jgi:hypothetical protein
MRVLLTVVMLELALVKLEPSQYLITTEFQSENPGLMRGSEAIK